MKTFQDFYPYTEIQWTTNGQNYSLSAASKGYKWYQTMNVLSSETIDHLKKKKKHVYAS